MGAGCSQEEYNAARDQYRDQIRNDLSACRADLVGAQSDAKSSSAFTALTATIESLSSRLEAACTVPSAAIDRVCAHLDTSLSSEEVASLLTQVAEMRAEAARHAEEQETDTMRLVDGLHQLTAQKMASGWIGTALQSTVTLYLNVGTEDKSVLESGTGFLVKMVDPHDNEEKVYIVTAAHCVVNDRNEYEHQPYIIDGVLRLDADGVEHPMDGVKLVGYDMWADVALLSCTQPGGEEGEEEGKEEGKGRGLV